MIEEVREKITKQFGNYATSFEVDGRYSEKPYTEAILSIKVGSITLRQLLELLEQGKLVKLSDNQEHPSFLTLGGIAAELVSRCREADDKAGFKKVEPL